MSQYRDTFPEDVFPFREYILVPVRYWYVVVAVFAIVMILASVFPRSSPDVFETQTKLLIVPPISERLITAQAPVSERLIAQQAGAQVAGTNLSVETLLALATASDLLQLVIIELDLNDPTSGLPWPAEQLAGKMSPEAEAAGLLTMTVRGGDPALLKRIANKWAEVFIRKNSELFATEAGRSYQFVLAQFQDIQDALRKLANERVQFIAENPPELLSDELGLKRSDLEQYQDTALDLSAQLILTTKDYEETLARLTELTVDGRWIGLQESSHANPGVVATTPEQISVLQAKDQLFSLQEQIKDFRQRTELTLLNQRLSLKRKLLSNYITGLEAAENNVSTESRTLEALEAEIEKQPQFLVLVKAIADPALWQQLGLNPTVDDWERIRELGLQTEEVNPAFTALTDRIILTRTSIETDRGRVELLTRRVEETQSEVKSLENEIADKEGIQFTKLRNELALAQSVYAKEQATYAALQLQAVDLRNTIRKIQPRLDEYQKLVDTYRADVKALSKLIATANVGIPEFDRQRSALENNFASIATSLQEARIANAEQAGSIRVVESAVEPQVPVPSGRRQNLVLAAVLGLALGAGLAMFVHYMRSPQASRQEPLPAPPEPPSPTLSASSP